MLVKNFMIEDVYVGRSTFTLKQLLQIFIENKIGGVPIVDEEDKLISVVTDGDILRHLVPKEQILKDYFTYFPIILEGKIDETINSKLNDKVEDLLANFEIVTLTPDSNFEDAIKVISKHHFKKIPVVDEDNHVVGIISRGDALRMLYKRYLL